MKFNFPAAHDRELYQLEKLTILKQKIRMITNWMAFPLFLFFWLCDLIFAPQLKWEFLIVRLMIIPIHLSIYYLIARTKKLRQGEWVSLSLITAYSAIINYMVFRLGDASSPYYAGLNLIAIGSLTFIPWRAQFFALANIVLFAPYLLSYYLLPGNQDLTLFSVNMFFIIGTATITLIIRLFHEALQIKEFNSRFLLNEELGNREKIIRKKTQEGLRLATLSSQFSPQVIEAIKSGDRTLDTNRHRSEICAIFVDAVASTDRLVRLDHRYFIEVIEEFMEIAINTLLKYDLTIDKFYGDGVLAFSNDPIKRSDFIERSCQAAIDIRQQIKERQNHFRSKWQKDFQITVGIASGFASVGFYGNKTFIKQYSAIGPCLALSQRLSSIAGPNEILVDQHIHGVLEKANFKLAKKGDFNLKGFEGDVFTVYNIVDDQNHFENTSFDGACSKCNENTVYIDESQGVYVLKCRKCGHVESEDGEQKKAA